MQKLYRLFGVATALFLFANTGLKADASGSGVAREATTNVSDLQDLFIIAPADINTGTDWEMCSVFIPEEYLGEPSIPEGCNCTVTNDADYYGEYGLGTTTITWTVTDEHGNQASDTQIITVVDQEPPMFPQFQPDTYEAVAEPGLCGAHVTFYEPAVETIAVR